MKIKSIICFGLLLSMLTATISASAISEDTDAISSKQSALNSDAEVRAYLESSPNTITTSEYDIFKQQQAAAKKLVNSKKLVCQQLFGQKR